MAERECTSAAPLVSAIIPARDAERYLARAIDSALAQTYASLEVIVVDDGSVDTTYEVAACYGERLRLIRLPRPVGPGAARNVGIEAARGTYVAFLDADDEWLPEKTARQVALIESAADLTFVFCGAVFISEASNAPMLVNQNRAPVSGPDAWKVLLAYPFVSTPTVLARREAVLRVGLFDPALPIAEDQDLWIRLARLGQIGYVEEVMARVHDTPGSLAKRLAHEGVVRALEVVDRHVKAAAGELTAAEIREIYAERSASLGRNAYEAGETMLGMRLLLRSIHLGRPTLPVLAYLLSASPLGRMATHRLRAGRAPAHSGDASAAARRSASNR